MTETPVREVVRHALSLTMTDLVEIGIDPPLAEKLDVVVRLGVPNEIESHKSYCSCETALTSVTVPRTGSRNCKFECDVDHSLVT